MIFSNDYQKNKYHQVWKEIFKIVNNGNGDSRFMKKLYYTIAIYLQTK